MKIVKTGDYIGTDEGRLYLNGLNLVWTCPFCRKIHRDILNRDSYYYDCIEANEDKVLKAYCNNCDRETEFVARLNIDFEIIN